MHREVGKDTSPDDCANNLNAMKVALIVLKRESKCVPMLVGHPNKEKHSHNMKNIL